MGDFARGACGRKYHTSATDFARSTPARGCFAVGEVNDGLLPFLIELFRHNKGIAARVMDGAQCAFGGNLEGRMLCGAFVFQNFG